MAVAGGLVAGVPAIPAATASTAATSIITIGATSPHYPGLRAKNHGLVDGDAIVVYKVTKKRENTAIVSGKVTTHATNDTATLLAKPFGAKGYSPIGTRALIPSSHGVARYSFNVTPSIATQYKVQVTGTDTAVSDTAPVYVTEGGRSAGGSEHCGQTTCRFSFRLYVLLPASALRTEISKHWYQYVAVGHPRLPKDYTLSTASTASKATKISSGEYMRRLTFVFPRNGVPAIQACVKDTESRDGMGLPGHHGCGDKHVSLSAIYLG